MKTNASMDRILKGKFDELKKLESKDISQDLGLVLELLALKKQKAALQKSATLSKAL